MTRTSSATIARTTTHHGRRPATRTTITQDAPAIATEICAEAIASCPTCLAAGDASIDALPGATHPGVLPALCPTCGVTSIEYGLVIAIDNVLVELHGIERLDATI